MGGMGIVEFLRARLDEDEAAARRSKADNAMNPNLRIPAGWVDGVADRVLREVEAKRRIVDRIESRRSRSNLTTTLIETLIDLASVYADHPDFDPDWAT